MDLLTQLQRHTFRYFWRETNPRNGLIPDNTPRPTFPLSAVAASLPFAPEIVIPALAAGPLRARLPEHGKRVGLVCSFNPTFPVPGSKHGWMSSDHFALDQGPVILMIENYRSA